MSDKTGEFFEGDKDFMLDWKFCDLWQEFQLLKLLKFNFKILEDNLEIPQYLTKKDPNTGKIQSTPLSSYSL